MSSRCTTRTAPSSTSGTRSCRTAPGGRIDLNRDWEPNAFAAKESASWYTYWAQMKPARGKAIKQNVRGSEELLAGLATGSVWDTDPMVWHTMPHVNYIGYQTDSGVVDGIWPAYPPVQP